MNDELKEALVDVRKAYRLVYLFQKNALQMVELISEQFPCDFYYWSPWFFGTTPQRTTNPLQRWAWDMLPFYCASIMFKKAESDPVQHKPGDWLLDINVMADSGFVESNTEPDPSSFIKPNEAETVITLYLSYCLTAFELNWSSGYWNAISYPDGEVSEIDEPAPIKIVSREYNLLDHYDESTVLNLVEDFKELVNKNIPKIGL